MTIMQSFAQDLYGQAGAEGAAGPEGAEAGEAAQGKAPEADTVDADFEVVDDEKKED
jgi:hypothetical protein